jgi:hypothetical protein
MAVTSSRRDVLQLGYGAAAPGALGPVPALPQGATLAQARNRCPDPRQRRIERRLVRLAS